MLILQIAIIILFNILSCYFWIWFYKELFKKNASIKEIAFYGLLSAIWSLSIIRWFGIQSIISKAATEESLKISSSIVGKKSQSRSLDSDYISYALLCGIWFGIVENIIYMYYTFGDSLLASGISRILTNTLLHSLFSWSIGYGIYLFVQRYSRKSLRILMIAWAIWVWLHTLYNRSLTQSYLAISIIFIIVWYYLLAFLLYQSDRLFIDNQIIDNVNWKV